MLSPRDRGYKTPHLFLVDFDKILNYSYKKKRFSKSNNDKFVNPLINKSIEQEEKFLYGRRRKEFLNLRSQIDNELNKDYKFDLKWGKGANNYLKLKNLIKSYCMKYNVIISMNTLEDIIINQKNIFFFKNWAINYNSDLNIKKNFGVDDLTLFRLLFSGKLNNLKTLKNNIEYIEELNDSNFPYRDSLIKYYEEIRKVSVSKTDWITDFIDCFFEEKINGKENEYNKKKVFEDYFPELFYIIEKIEALLN